MIATVVFDFDGTLVDSNGIKRQGFFTAVASHAGGDAIMRRVLDEIAGDRRAIFGAYAELQARLNPLHTHDAESMVNEYTERVDAAVAAAAEMPGATQLLEALRRDGKHVYL